jgi:outer membrane lipoprotein LolB
VQLDSGAQTQRFAHLDTMMEALVGEALPLAALFDWLEGRPWPDEASRPLAETDGPGFRQLGWKVSTGRLADGLLVAERRLPEPALTVRIRLDTPS